MTTPAGSHVWQVISDCPHCKTAGAVLELMDADHPACHLGIPTISRCRMCGLTHTAEAAPFVPRDPFGSNRCPSCRKPLSIDSRDARQCSACDFTVAIATTPGLDVQDAQAVRAGLERWADEEGVSLDELCTGSLGAPVDTLVARYRAGEPVESTADAIAFLFPGMAAGSALGANLTAREPTDRPERTPRPPDLRAPARLLVSVMVADGQIRQGEQAFVERFLQQEGLDPLTPRDLRPWRPHEVGPIADRALAERTVRAAVELMHLDGERDGSEDRIVRTFARAWGVPDRDLARWSAEHDRRYAPRLAVVWRALSRWVRTR
jgi:hypothetical protein